MFFRKAHEGKNAWWRWTVTIGGTLAAWFVGHLPVLAFIEVERQRLGLDEDAFFSGPFPAGVNQNVFLFLALIPFAVAFFALWLLVRGLHGKPLVSAMTGRPRFDWRRAFVAFAVWLAVAAIGTFILMPVSAYTFQFDPARFVPLLLIAVLVLPLQTTFEEVFFRGYLMQGVYLLSRSRMAALVVVTTIFVLIHLANPEFARDYVTGFVLYLTISVLLGLSAVLDDGLEVPIGLHAANNFFLVTIISSPDGSFATPSLYSAELSVLMANSPWLDMALAAAAFCILAALYGWRFGRLREPTAPLSDPVDAG